MINVTRCWYECSAWWCLSHPLCLCTCPSQAPSSQVLSGESNQTHLAVGYAAIVIPCEHGNYSQNFIVIYTYSCQMAFTKLSI